MSIDIDPGVAGVGNPQLVRAIVDEMAGGTIPFERFMELALYHPQHGYYRKSGRIGTSGDFLTSPTISPLFGWAVAAWCRDVWQRLGEPSSLPLIEVGAGAGELARAILDWAEGRGNGFARALRYVAVEPNSPGADARVTWRADLPGPVEHGIVLSNELFDAFPVRLFDAGVRGPVEVHVRWDGERFVEAQGPVVSLDDAPEAGRFEVNQHAYAAMRRLSAMVGSGAVLTFDYGYPQEELWAPWRTQGTLLCFYRHTAHEDPLLHVGEQDITAHVNFSDLESALADEGMTTFGPVSQAQFLHTMGIGQLVERVRSDMSEYFIRRRAVQTLTDSAGLGRVRVLAGTRGIEGAPAGFEDGAR